MLRCSSCDNFQYILSVCKFGSRSMPIRVYLRNEESKSRDRLQIETHWSVSRESQCWQQRIVPRGLGASFKWFPLLNYHLIFHEAASKVCVEEVFVPVVCVEDIGCGRKGDFCAAVCLPHQWAAQTWGFVRTPCSPKSWHHLHSRASFRLPSPTVVGTFHSGDTLVQLMAQKLLGCLLQCSWSGHIICNSSTSS